MRTCPKYKSAQLGAVAYHNPPEAACCNCVYFSAKNCGFHEAAALYNGTAENSADNAPSFRII